MDSHPLDNPLWQSLTTKHAGLAIANDVAARYPAAVAPFAAVANASREAGDRLRQIIEPGESVYLVGVAPPLDAGWQVLLQTSIAQMVCHARIEPKPGPQFRALTDADRADMIELTTRVFPGYFRARTNEMGRYIGIYAGNTLAAMAGERMCLDGYVEISAVCTHPDFTSRGFAAHLVGELCHEILSRRLTPFLHVSWENARARALYAKLGFVDRASVALWSVLRED
ncbi:GNAT family N-acetyltransferase [Povalibacter sp.]|uniref:GNAT family N-acetyltransferase n=1 Tax=Povalibacter sp. TaxID=1962978 RepID=UPI002F407F9F